VRRAGCDMRGAAVRWCAVRCCAVRLVRTGLARRGSPMGARRAKVAAGALAPASITPSSGAVVRFFGAFAGGVLEIANAFPDPAPDFRQAIGAEDQNHDHEDDDELRQTKASHR
jgi:hypothetical protein